VPQRGAELGFPDAVLDVGGPPEPALDVGRVLEQPVRAVQLVVLIAAGGDVGDDEADGVGGQRLSA